MLESNSDTIWNKERLAVVFNKKNVTIQNPIRKIASSMLLFCSCGYLAI